MDLKTFQRVVSSFTDKPSDVEKTKNEMILQIRDEVVVASLTIREGDVYVTEGDTTTPAGRWIAERLGRLSTLAARVLEFVPEEPHLVVPSCQVLRSLESKSGDAPVQSIDALSEAQAMLSERPAGLSSVVYLTGDAGEGKTTLIDALARSQAEKYRRRESNWLLIPVPLAGRNLIRFDEAVLGALVQRLRFQMLYFDAFIELVRMGCIVPAFDGFEELFVQTDAGGGFSALGSLMKLLNGEGTVLIAARKAYFEYKSLGTQVRLLDALGESMPSFSRITLDQWSRADFVEYCGRLGRMDGEEIFDVLAKHFGPHHPFLTRAVLVKSLLTELVGSAQDAADFVAAIAKDTGDQFTKFVHAMVDREAREKWIDYQMDPPQSLLTAAQHHRLLALVAEEMWISETQEIGLPVLLTVADLFCGEQRLSAAVFNQVKLRIPQHALLRRVEDRAQTYAFEHVEFFGHYLGLCIGTSMSSGSVVDLKDILRRGPLSDVCCDSAVGEFMRLGGEGKVALESLGRATVGEVHGSYVQTNTGRLIARLLQKANLKDQEVIGVSLPENGLSGRALTGVRFVDCYFGPTDVVGATLEHCEFRKCKFERLELPSSSYRAEVLFVDCTIRCLAIGDADDFGDEYYAPAQIEAVLAQLGLLPKPAVGGKPSTAVSREARLVIALRVLRAFFRSPVVGKESVYHRLRHVSPDDVDAVLAQLVHAKILVDVSAGRLTHMRLNVPVGFIHDALQVADGRFDTFVRAVADAVRRGR